MYLTPRRALPGGAQGCSHLLLELSGFENDPTLPKNILEMAVLNSLMSRPCFMNHYILNKSWQGEVLSQGVLMRGGLQGANSNSFLQENKYSSLFSNNPETQDNEIIFSLRHVHSTKLFALSRIFSAN